MEEKEKKNVKTIKKKVTPLFSPLYIDQYFPFLMLLTAFKAIQNNSPKAAVAPLIKVFYGKL